MAAAETDFLFPFLFLQQIKVLKQTSFRPHFPVFYCGFVSLLVFLIYLFGGFFALKPETLPLIDFPPHQPVPPALQTRIAWALALPSGRLTSTGTARLKVMR